MIRFFFPPRLLRFRRLASLGAGDGFCAPQTLSVGGGGESGEQGRRVRRMRRGRRH